jgi:5-formyltetrahydrofolate cyclo-ligase
VSAPLAPAKVRLRALVREWLAAVPAEERAERSERVLATLGAISDVRTAATLLLHRSLPTEVATEGLLAAALDREQRVFVPRVDGSRLTFVRVTHETAWRRSTLGVLEPEAGEALGGGDLRRGRAIVIVPGIAFDLRGGRLGRGGGHYDRYLREVRREGPVEVIALAFNVQIVADVPRTDQDEAVDRIVTESRIIIASNARRPLRRT